MKDIAIGCIADDFTGAGDAASFLASSGLQTVLLSEIAADDTLPADCQAVVVALKSRNALAETAVKDSLKALEWLKEKGARQIYIKYCSTFDSTDKGNIGPVIDAVLETLQETYTVICPSLPVNGRTVRNGRLFVNGIPLDESPMKDHPLTPMWDSRISQLMKKQGKYDCLVLGREEMGKSSGEILDMVKQFGEMRPHFYVIPEYESQKDGEKIVNVFGNLPVLTGGSGLLEPLAGVLSSKENQWESRKSFRSMAPQSCSTKTLLLAGSCSAMTLKQIQFYQRQGLPSLKISPSDVLAGILTPKEAIDRLLESGETPFLLYSSDTPQQVARIQQDIGSERACGCLEQFMAETAVLAYRNGFHNFIVAGGETSGAVTMALGFRSFLIGPSAAPGVPLLIPVRDLGVSLILKSGNFGKEDFFAQAVRLAEDRAGGMR